jgi:hypothetical protein
MRSSRSTAVIRSKNRSSDISRHSAGCNSCKVLRRCCVHTRGQ